MKYTKQIVFITSLLVNAVALGFFMKFWDPVREFFKSPPPAQQIQQHKVTEKKSPQKAELKEAILRQREKIEVCYDDYLRREPKNSNGSLAVKWTVSSAGKVQEAEVTDNNIKDVDLEECVLHEVAQMTFDPDKFAENTQFSYRFHFKARAPAAVEFE